MGHALKDGSVVLTGAEAAELAEEVTSLMHRWHPSDREADYACELCHRRPATNSGEVDHAPDCPGARALLLLRPPPP